MWKKTWSLISWGVLENLEGASTDWGLFCWVPVVKNFPRRDLSLVMSWSSNPGKKLKN